MFLPAENGFGIRVITGRPAALIESAFEVVMELIKLPGLHPHSNNQYTHTRAYFHTG